MPHSQTSLPLPGKSNESDGFFDRGCIPHSVIYSQAADMRVNSSSGILEHQIQKVFDLESDTFGIGKTRSSLPPGSHICRPGVIRRIPFHKIFQMKG